MATLYVLYRTVDLTEYELQVPDELLTDCPRKKDAPDLLDPWQITDELDTAIKNAIAATVPKPPGLIDEEGCDEIKVT